MSLRSSYPVAGQQAVCVVLPHTAHQIARLQIYINNLAVGPCHVDRLVKTQWHCERCGHTVHSKQQMLAHLYTVHYRRMLAQQAARMPLVG